MYTNSANVLSRTLALYHLCKIFVRKCNMFRQVLLFVYHIRSLTWDCWQNCDVYCWLTAITHYFSFQCTIWVCEANSGRTYVVQKVPKKKNKYLISKKLLIIERRSRFELRAGGIRVMNSWKCKHKPCVGNVLSKRIKFYCYSLCSLQIHTF